jgi:hypothetical protein
MTENKILQSAFGKPFESGLPLCLQQEKARKQKEDQKQKEAVGGSDTEKKEEDKEEGKVLRRSILNGRPRLYSLKSSTTCQQMRDPDTQGLGR